MSKAGVMTELDEQRLITQAQHDPQAFGVLYDHYLERIYAFVYRQTHDEALAAEITSATFEQALRHLRRYQWRGHSFGAWLYRIAHNALLQHYRRERFFQPLRQLWAADTDIEHETQVAEEYQILHQGLARLSHRDREVLILRFFEELSTAEVATILNCSPANVYVRVHRALQHLRAHLTVLDAQGVCDVPG